MNPLDNFTLIPVDMVGRTRIKADMVFDLTTGKFTNLVYIEAGGKMARWMIFPNGHRHIRWMDGDRNLKPRCCTGAANYIRHYVKTHAARFEELLRTP